MSGARSEEEGNRLSAPVESGVKYAKRHLLSLIEARDLSDANSLLGEQVVPVSGQRTRGTTGERPLERFESIERQLLKPQPAVAPECAFWRRAKLHPDCHLLVDKVRYSAPWRLVGQTLDVRVSETTVRIYHEHEQQALHVRGAGPGARRTLDEYLPPDAVAYKQRDPVWCREKADAVGPHCRAVVGRLLGNPVLRRLRSLQGIVGLAILIAGRCGTGKSHIAHAIGHAAVRQGVNVMFSTKTELLRQLNAARATGEFERKMQTLVRVPSLIIDDFGLKPLKPGQDEDFHDLIAERYERSATIVTSNLDFKKWGQAFPNRLLGALTSDRDEIRQERWLECADHGWLQSGDH